jgi:SAM-dependent methyltransferase
MRPRHLTDDGPRYEPWLKIPAEDYEGHMSSPQVGQLAALSDALAEACARSRPGRLLVIGCATGNGLERVDSRVTRRVVGIDVNPRYLELAQERLGDSCTGLELVCADVERHEFAPGSFDLIFAGLILEYVRPNRLLDRMADWIADDGRCSVVVQLPDTEHALVSETEFESLRALAPVMQLLTAPEVERLVTNAGMRILDQWKLLLPDGKRLLSMWLGKVQ